MERNSFLTGFASPLKDENPEALLALRKLLNSAKKS